MNRCFAIVIAKTVFGVGLALGFAAAPHGVAQAHATLTICQYEDGNTDGLPCMWTDADTGTQYYVDSSNYR
jgi:hypothetical protein